MDLVLGCFQVFPGRVEDVACPAQEADLALGGGMLLFEFGERGEVAVGVELGPASD